MMEKARYSQDPMKVALRILARIIAREVVHQQLAKIDGLSADPAPLDPVIAQVSDYVRNPRTDH
jgi:hypothetical protein